MDESQVAVLSSPSEYQIVPIESHLFVIGGASVVSVESNSGTRQVRQEKLRIRRRRAAEAAFLYSDAVFSWAEPIDAGVFELLVLELLHQERGVEWVKKVGPTNERDQGRDLTALWRVAPNASDHPAESSRGGPSVSVAARLVLVQCKTSAKAIGKSKVPDIYDTLRLHDADGYLLVAYPEPSGALIAHLEAMRKRREHWVDWWSQIDIEDRLRANPEILSRYKQLVWVDMRSRNTAAD